MRRLLPFLGILLVPLALLLGIYLGGHPSSLPDGLRDRLVGDSQAQVYDQAVDMIARDYYKKVDPDELLDTSLDAAVKSLKDPFSHYFDAETYQRFQEVTSGAFEGIGTTVQEHPKGLRIVQVFKGGPAAKAGIKRGDLITAVDGRSIAGKSSEESTARIKGKAGTKVRLTLRRAGKERTLTVTRASVAVPVVDARMETVDGRKVAYARLESFTSGAHGELRRAIRGLLDKGAKGVVLDLRDNGGGLLNEAVLVSSIFIPEGEIVSIKGRARESRTFEASGRSIDTDVPVVVLVNKGSASASEIVSGAIQDRDRGTVVGTQTFGKGVFQEVQQLPNGGALDITVGEYYTPKGRNLGPRNGKPGGLKPDVKAQDDPDTQRDEGLEAALEALVADS